jgi:hypothetical protein
MFFRIAVKKEGPKRAPLDYLPREDSIYSGEAGNHTMKDQRTQTLK